MKPQQPRAVKLFFATLFSDVEIFAQTVEALEESFGKIDFRSPHFDFKLSDYYKKEMGWPITRKFVSFLDLIDPETLPTIKLKSNALEEKFAFAGKRKVNLDPGYMDFNKVVLASAKGDSQKIYLAKGIYADPTLWYEKGKFKPAERAFPDFKSGDYENTFLHIRSLLKKANATPFSE